MSTADLVEAVCKQIEPLVMKGQDVGENRYGVVVQYNKADIGIIAFSFVTQEDMEITLTIDAKNQSWPQIQEMIGDIHEGIVAKRRERFLRAKSIYDISRAIH